MLHRLSLKIANRYAAKDINHHPIDVVAYGIESLIANVVIIGSLFLFGLILKRFVPILVYTFAWLILRIMVGGLHANTHLMCTILSVGLGVASVILSEFMVKLPFYISALLIFLCYIIFYLIAPVVHKNHPMSKRRRNIMSKVAKVYAAFEGLVILLMHQLNPTLFSAALMAYITTALLGLIGYFSRDSLKQFE